MSTKQPVCRHFQRYSSSLPLPSQCNGATRLEVGDSHVISIVTKSRMLALVNEIFCVVTTLTLGKNNSKRFSDGQDSKTPVLLFVAFITTGLAGVPPATCLIYPTTALWGRLIRLSFQLGFELAFNARSPSSFPSGSWCITAPSAACGVANVAQFPAPHRLFSNLR